MPIGITSITTRAKISTMLLSAVDGIELDAVAKNSFEFGAWMRQTEGRIDKTLFSGENENLFYIDDL